LANLHRRLAEAAKLRNQCQFPGCRIGMCLVFAPKYWCFHPHQRTKLKKNKSKVNSHEYKKMHFVGPKNAVNNHELK
jgi:hypothetical protein